MREYQENGGIIKQKVKENFIIQMEIRFKV